jgi:hypothetical protein
MVVQQMILLHGGKVTEDSQFGQLLAKAAKDIEVCALSYSRQIGLKQNPFSSLIDEHYCRMVSTGAFTQAGELNVNLQCLPQVYDDFFGRMLDLFLAFSVRSVISFWPSVI